MNLDEIKTLLQEIDPNKIIVDIDEFEREDHQTYKWLYENLNQNHDQTLAELNSVIFEKQNAEREASELSAHIQELKDTIAALTTSNTELLAMVEKYVKQEIIVTDIATDPPVEEKNKIHPEQFVGSISERPGVYDGKRAGWFIPIKQELSKENVRQKNVAATSDTLKDRLLFWKKHKGKQDSAVMAEYEKNRKNNIIELLQSSCSNQEKYLKYFLLTPGLDRDFAKTLQGASDIGLNANLVIALLEQPNDMYNKEIIEMYISEIHRGTEYNLKQELAEELVKGEWSIVAKINGKSARFQLVPIEELDALKVKIEAIASQLSVSANGEVCANLAQTSPDDHEYVKDIDEYVPVNDDSSMIQFDDSMLN